MFDGYNRLNLSNSTPTSTTLGLPDGTTRDLTTQSNVYIYEPGTYTANVQTSETFAYLSNVVTSQPSQNPTDVGPTFTFDEYNRLAISNLTQTSSTLEYGSNTYDTNTASNVYVTDAGEYKLEARDANTFVMSNVYVGAVSQHPTDVVPTLTFDGYNKLTIDNVDTVETATIKKDGAAFATTTSNTVYIRDTGTYTAEVKGSGAYAIELSNVVTGTVSQHPADVVPSLTYDNYNKITLENMNYEDTATVSDPNGSTYNLGTAKTMYVKDTGEYVFKISGTDKYVESNVYVSSVDLEGAPTKPIDFDGYNKLTLIDAGSNVSANVTYFSNTYELGSANVLYINGAGTYDLEMSGSNVFALSNTVVSAVDTTITEFAFHYEAFNSSYYSDKYSSASDAAAAGVVYSDTATGTYSWGTLNSIDTSTSGQVGYSWTPSSAMIANVLIVGGGGGGGNGQNNVYWSSAGGGGKVQNLTNQTISVGTYSIVVGNGSPNSTAGTTSSAFGTSAVGGGAGSVGTSGTSGSGNGPGSNSGYNVGGGGGDASSGGNAGNKGGSGGDGSNVSWLDGSIYGEQVGGQAYFGGGGFGGDSGGPTTGKGNNLPGTGGGGSYGQVGRSGIVVIRSGPTSEPPSLTFDGYNKLTLENFTTTESDTRTAKLTDPNGDTYSLGQTQNDIYIEETGDYTLEVTNSDQSAVVKKTIGAGQISEPPESYVPSNASTSIPTLITNIPFISGSWSSTLSAERHSDFDYDTRIVYRQMPWPDVSSTYNIMAYDYVTKRWYDEGSSNPSVITDTSTYVSGQTYTSQNPKKVYGWSGPTGLLFEIDNPYYVDYSPPTLTFDNYNKLSINNLTPTSSRLTYGSNTYEIGTASNVYIEHAGTYKMATGDANTFALVSNVVTGTPSQHPQDVGPTFTYDTSNKLSITGITPTATTLTDPNGSSLDIGTATDVYIRDSGKYAIASKDANTFLLTSNTVTGTPTGATYAYSTNTITNIGLNKEIDSASAHHGQYTHGAASNTGRINDLNFTKTILTNGYPTDFSVIGTYVARTSQTLENGQWTSSSATSGAGATTNPYFRINLEKDYYVDNCVLHRTMATAARYENVRFQLLDSSETQIKEVNVGDFGATNTFMTADCKVSGVRYVKVVTYSSSGYTHYDELRINGYDSTLLDGSATTPSQTYDTTKTITVSNDIPTDVTGKIYKGSTAYTIHATTSSSNVIIENEGTYVSVFTTATQAFLTNAIDATQPTITSDDTTIEDAAPIVTTTVVGEPLTYKAYLKTGINVNASTSWTAYDIFGSGYSEEINQGGFTLANSNLVAPETGYYRLSFNIYIVSVSGTGERTHVGVKPRVEGTDLNEISASNYIRVANGHDEASTSMSTIIYLTGNKEVNLKFARLSTVGRNNQINPGSLVTLEKVTTSTLYKAYLKTGINVNASTSWTAYDIFGSGYSEEINQGGFTLANSNLVAPETGYYRLSFNVYVYSTGDRTNVGVKPTVEGTDLNEISASDYIRNYEGHNEASTNMSTIVYLSGNKEVNLKFARLTDTTTSVTIQSGSFITLEKI
jgi:hypothetical protein